MGKIIGIDLGTTTCEVAYIENGQPKIILNDRDKKITPSVVGFTDEEILVGELAKRQAILNPDKTVMEVKRLMGEKAKIDFGGEKLLPEYISAMILKKLKEDAEKYLGEIVTEAVITVPANFNNLQRKATKSAGKLAGLKVDRIINEPTAAALAYGINNLNTNEKILVYDLGGGTFDVTVLELFEGVIDVKSSRGDNKIGGKNFNEIIESYIINNFEAQYGVSLRENKKAIARIKQEAEKCKIELSYKEEVDINIPFISEDIHGNPLDINTNLTRDKFEAFIADLVDSTEVLIDDAIKSAGYTANDIDVVIPVGGSSRMPCIRRLLEEKFNNKIRYEIDPEEAVAFGAAIQAGIKNEDIKSDKGILITDACSYTLGTSIVEKIGDGKFMEGIYDPIILRDTKIPCTVKKMYNTIKDNQKSVIVDIYQGEERLAKKNIKIGEFNLKGIPKALAGKECIEISFSYDLNEVLEVTAKVLSTGKSITKTINISTEDIEKDNHSVKRKNDIKKSLKKWEEATLYTNFKGIVNFAEKKMSKIEDSKIKNKLKVCIDKLKKSVICEEKIEAEKYNEELTELLFEID